MIKLLPAVLAASALHAAVWVGFMQRSGSAPNAAPSASQVRAPMQWVRVVSRAPSLPAVAPAVGPTPPPMLDAAPSPQPTPQPTEPPPEAMPPQAPAEGEVTWWPRPQLTQPPVPQTLVSLDFPPDDPETGRHRVVLNVYIDEAGHVQRVQLAPDSEPVPSDYFNAARDAFLATRFAPGEIQGQVVKSLIRMEVVFDQRVESSVVSRGQVGAH
ncbi:MAG: hypothetical protein RI907_855 [Pseudomonadota bacterium]|jgi:hypothetical protein